jgi:hypothetical protein
MSDYLPEIVERVDEETPTPSPDNITAEITDTEDVKGDDAFEGDEEIIKEELIEQQKQEEEEKEEEVVEEEGEKVPLVKTRRKLKQDEVFTTPKVKPVAPLEEKKEEPKKKGKRKCSEKQLAHLAKIRQKGLEAARAKNAKNAKDPNYVPKKKKERQVAEAKVSEEVIERISTNAIEKYEVKRKERKALKKKAQEEEEHKKKVKQTINRAMKNPDPDDIWAAALGGMMN